MMRTALILVLLTLSGCSLVQDRATSQQQAELNPGDERVTESWHCVVGEDRLWHCREPQQPELAAETPTLAAAEEFSPLQEPAPAPMPMAQAEPAYEEEPPELAETENAPVAEDADAADGYVLQLGAYSDRSNAEQFLESLQNVEGRILQTSGSSGDRYLVLTSAYPDPVSAREAAETLLDNNPGVDYWIRAEAELNNPGPAAAIEELGN